MLVNRTSNIKHVALFWYAQRRHFNMSWSDIAHTCKVEYLIYDIN